MWSAAGFVVLLLLVIALYVRAKQHGESLATLVHDTLDKDIADLEKRIAHLEADAKAKL